MRTKFYRQSVSAIIFLYIAIFMPTKLSANDQQPLCLDGFCIGQSIKDARFDKVSWITPSKNLNEEKCAGLSCKPDVAFRGYPAEEQLQFANSLKWAYGSIFPYNIVTNDNLELFRKYSYECNASARGIWGERRFFAAYKSMPSKYFTVVGLRLIGDELKVYRIAREYPYHTQDELRSLAKKLFPAYGHRVLFYDYLSSNAYSDVIEQNKDGWFARSTMYTPSDLSNNVAELVLIDPQTRGILEPSSMPTSGEIKPLAMHLSKHCNQEMPIQ